MSWSYISDPGCFLEQISFLISNGAARPSLFTIEGESTSTSNVDKRKRKNMSSESAVKSSKSSVCPLRNIVIVSAILSKLSGNNNAAPSSSLLWCLFSLLLWCGAVVCIHHLLHSSHIGPVKVMETVTRSWHPRHPSNATVTSGSPQHHHYLKTSADAATAAVSPTIIWQLGPTFDPELSTEDNYRANREQPEDDGALCGKFVEIRRGIDYQYHKIYSCERQHFQDALVESMLSSTTLMDDDGQTCSRPTRNWIVFTAGVMGAGKSYTIHKLNDKGRFPLNGFVTVDPDMIRQHFPEYGVYNNLAPERAGELTRKEAGVVSEILTEAALRRGQNVLVDGSLRNASWYLDHFMDLRTRYPSLQIAIVHVTAPREAVFERAANRAQVTGRVVPRDLLEQVMEEVPKSVEILSSKVDFCVEILNPPDADDVEIVTGGITWDFFRKVWKQSCPTPS